MKTEFGHSWWQAHVYLREEESKDSAYGGTLTNFSTRELAVTFIEEAYKGHLTALGNRTDAFVVQTGPIRDKEGSAYDCQVTWNKETEKGCFGQKDYFSVEPRSFHLLIEE